MLENTTSYTSASKVTKVNRLKEMNKNGMVKESRDDTELVVKPKEIPKGKKSNKEEKEML